MGNALNARVENERRIGRRQRRDPAAICRYRWQRSAGSGNFTWGEGQLNINGREIAHINDAKDRRQAFRAIKLIAERYVETHMNKDAEPMLPAVKAKLLEGKQGLIVGIANDKSIAWGCAKAFRAFGAEVEVTYLNDKAKKFVEPLARALEAPIFMPLDVSVAGQMEAVFQRISKEWGKLDYVVHSIAFSPKEALQGRVVDVSRE